MAEAKNTFIKSKMNKDLDDRLIPSGEYRDGQNIAVSRSEDSDVGAVENILGNKSITDFGLTSNIGIEVIGHYMDVPNEVIYLFLTNYGDTSISKLSNDASISGDVECHIVQYNIKANSHITLISGSWLNFSKTHPISGVNLIEDLLFWTDNRNQPRKINVEIAAIPGNDANSTNPYYTNEDHISVAKYYPFKCIDLYKKETDTSSGNLHEYVSTMRDVVSEYLPIHTAQVIQGTVTNQNYLAIKENNYNIAVGSKVTGEDIVGDCVVTGIAPNIFSSGNTRVYFEAPQAVQTTTIDKIVYFQSPNPDYNQHWPGDPRFLEDKFVRFSYRFKFDDGEYSLMAPFTQIAFVPKQDGYFINTDLKHQEDDTYRSTIVKFMENKINDITLIINGAEDSEGTILFRDLFNKLKVTEIDILYKESDGVSVKVLDTIKKEEFEVESSGAFEYNYQSRKPWRTLPEREIVRAWDKVPIRALSQETSGNRVIYGNYIDRHTSPDNLNYTVQIGDKADEPDGYTRKEYQNHTLKQDRTYQVGIVLSDRYGRQSNVILSSIKSSTNLIEKGSTIFHPYKPEGYLPGLISGGDVPGGDNDTWPGDMLSIWFYDTIPSELLPSEEGYPGLYSTTNGEVIGLTKISGGTGYSATTLSVGGISTLPIQNTTTTTVSPIGGGPVQIIPGDTLTVNIDSVDTDGAIEGISIVNPGLGYSNGDTITINAGGKNATYLVTVADPNPLGWYSYKIVIKQTEQEYYNVYLPGMLNAYPSIKMDGTSARWISTTDSVPPEFTTEGDQTAHVVLLNDNINKIPRDLKEVGPDERIYRSSVRLMGRVTNFELLQGETHDPMSNRQYYPDNTSDIVSTIGKMTELSLGGTVSFDPQLPKEFYKGVVDPLVAQISTDNAIGLTSDVMACPYLSVYETEPVESKMELFWETSTSGLISELNYNIENTDSGLPTGIVDPEISHHLIEGSAPGTYCSGIFYATNAAGASLSGTTTIRLMTVMTGATNAAGVTNWSSVPITYDSAGNVVSPFELVDQGSIGGQIGTYRLRTGNSDYFLSWEDANPRTYTFGFEVIRTIDGLSKFFSHAGEVKNVEPEMIGRLANLSDWTSTERNTFGAQGITIGDGDGFWKNNQPLHISGDGGITYGQSVPIPGGVTYEIRQGQQYEDGQHFYSNNDPYHNFNTAVLWHRHLTPNSSGYIEMKTFYPTTRGNSYGTIAHWGGLQLWSSTGYDSGIDLYFEAFSGSYKDVSNPWLSKEIKWSIGDVIQYGAFCYCNWGSYRGVEKSSGDGWSWYDYDASGHKYERIHNDGWWRVLFGDKLGMYAFTQDGNGFAGSGNSNIKTPKFFWPGIPCGPINLKTSASVSSSVGAFIHLDHGGCNWTSAAGPSGVAGLYPGMPWDFREWKTDFESKHYPLPYNGYTNLTYSGGHGNFDPEPGGAAALSGASVPIGFKQLNPWQMPYSTSDGEWRDPADYPNVDWIDYQFTMETGADGRGRLKVPANYAPGMYRVEIVAADKNGSGLNTSQGHNIVYKKNVWIEIVPPGHNLGDYRDVSRQGGAVYNSNDGVTSGRYYFRPDLPTDSNIVKTHKMFDI